MYIHKHTYIYIYINVYRTVASVNLSNNFAFLTPKPDEPGAGFTGPAVKGVSAGTGGTSSSSTAIGESVPPAMESILNVLVGAVLQMDARYNFFYTYTYIYIYIYKYLCTYIYVSVYIYISVSVYMYIYIYIFIYI
jgi:hypothetical protein